MDINTLLIKYKIKADSKMLLDMWNEPHRHYHSLNHYIDINNMINEDYANGKIKEVEYEKLLLTNLFHDIIYNPTRADNEQQSADFFISLCTEKENSAIKEIKCAILDTASHKASIPLSEKFNKYDMNIVERGYEQLLEWEKGIHEEYKMFGDKYKEGRLHFLNTLLDKYPLNSTNLLQLMEHVKNNY